MKHGKRPTRRQKLAIQAVNLNVENWLVYKAGSDKLHIVHRFTDTKRVIPL